MTKEATYTIPGHVRGYIEKLGYEVPSDQMEPYIRKWMGLYRAEGSFWDYKDDDGTRSYEMHRRTIRPFKRVCVEWSSLILGDKTTIGTSEKACNDYLDALLPRIGFISNGQALIQRAFALGTACWAAWFDSRTGKVQVRRYDARMIIPLTWDDDGIQEIALCTRVTVKGKVYDQLQLHLLGDDGYVIINLYFDDRGEQVSFDGVIDRLETHSQEPWFAVIKPALDNDLVDMSPYGVSVYKDAVDALKSVDMVYDAMMTEVDLGKLRIFLSDQMFEVEDENGETKPAIPFGRSDATIYRQGYFESEGGKPIYEYAPALRSDAQSHVYRISLQTMGDLCGFGLDYFDIDSSGGLRTATEVSADNSQLMRNLRNHEKGIQTAVETIIRAVLQASSYVGVDLPEPKQVTVQFDDSIVQDTPAEKAQDMAEVAAGLMQRWEYRMKWYGEDEAKAKEMAGAEAMDLGE
ncbi:MAG: phage portal protein [Eggerthellaceae bacterium]|nr:phage portal protein [Eggerthellaceae bacterium]